MKESGFIFDWKGKDSSLSTYLLAIFFVSIGFLLCFQIVELRIPSPLNQTNEEVSVFHLADSEKTNEWILKAREDGPFPLGFSNTRKDLNEILALLAPRNGLSEYVPKLRVIDSDLPIKPVKLAISGSQVFPKINVTQEVQKSVKPKLASRKVPVLKPLNLEAQSAIPELIPPFDLDSSNIKLEEERKMLVLLSAQGIVKTIVPLDADSGNRDPFLVDWLKKISFREANHERWIAMSVKFKLSAVDDTNPN